MQPNILSDNESSTGSSGHKKEASLVRYRCPRCSQVFFCEKDTMEHEVQSDEMTTKVTRNVLNLMPPHQQRPTRAIAQRAPPLRVRHTHGHSRPRTAGGAAAASHAHRNHPYQWQKSPVVVVAEQEHDDDDGSKRTRDFLSLFNGPGPNPTGHGGYTKLTPRGPIGWGRQEPESIKWERKGLDLKLKLWV